MVGVVLDEFGSHLEANETAGGPPPPGPENQGTAGGFPLGPSPIPTPRSCSTFLSDTLKSHFWPSDGASTHVLWGEIQEKNKLRSHHSTDV